MAKLDLIASVLQVADIGVRLSLKVYTFCHASLNADDSITFISKDISHTSAILRELGQCLEKDHDAQLCSENAFRTTSTIVNECRIVFEEVEQALMNKMARMGLDGDPGQPKLAILERSTWPFLQPKINLLWNNLKELKSTLHIMLNVIIYARLVAGKIAPTSAADQQCVIIEHLLRLHIEQTQNHKSLQFMIEEKSLEIVREVMTLAKNSTPAMPLRSSPAPIGSLACGTVGPMWILRANDTKTRTVEHYCDLIDNLLRCVDFEDYTIDSVVRTRIRDDIVEVHKRETRYLEGIYGAEDLKDAMRGKYWKLADMDGERCPLDRAMYYQSSSSLSDNAQRTDAPDVTKNAETTKIKPSDAKTSGICLGNSVFEGLEEARTEASPQALRKEMKLLRFEPKVPITRSSASATEVDSEPLDAIDRMNVLPTNPSQSDGATREHSECAVSLRRDQQRNIATVENLDNCAVKILDQETEPTEESLEEADIGTTSTPLLQSGISKRLAWCEDGYPEKTDRLRRASILPLRTAHQGKPNPKYGSLNHARSALGPDHARSCEPALPREQVIEVPRPAVRNLPQTANAQSSPLSYTMGIFLNDLWEDPITQKEAPEVRMPSPAWYEPTTPDDSGTSMMVTERSRIRESVSTFQDLPGLTISSKSSAITSEGGSSLAAHSNTEAGTILAPVSENSAHDAARILECPFNQLACSQTFADSKEWITHSLTHFGVTEPPTTNRCTFCDKQFYSTDAAQSWTERMNHVALHHRLGQNLSGARWDNTVYIYTHMYEKGLLDISFLCEFVCKERDRHNTINILNSGPQVGWDLCETRGHRSYM